MVFFMRLICYYEIDWFTQKPILLTFFAQFNDINALKKSNRLRGAFALIFC
jgi:hypothetical protein